MWESFPFVLPDSHENLMKIKYIFLKTAREIDLTIKYPLKPGAQIIH